MKLLTSIAVVFGLWVACAAPKEPNGLPPELVERLRDTRILEKSCAFVCTPDGKHVLGTGFSYNSIFPRAEYFL